MIIYLTYFAALSVFFMSTTWIFDPLFQAVGIPSGYRSIVLQALVGAIALIFLTRSRPPRLAADLGGAVAAWVPWLVYAAFRCDFSDANAVLYFAKLVLIQFVSVLALIVIYRSDPRLFTRYFLISTIILGVVIIVKTIMDPEVFVYAMVVERLTIETINPIWLSRSFAFAAICVMFLPIRSTTVKILGVLAFVLAMVPTGSRGPLGALGVVVALVLLSKYAATRTFMLACLGFGVILIATAFIPGLGDGIADFFSRGRSVGVFQESGRSAMFSQAMAEFISAPLVGIGLTKFGAGDAVITFQNAARSYPHNMILEVLSGTGVIGFALFVYTFRFGRWLLAPGGLFYFLFIYSCLVAMTSGDLNANNGVIIFAVLARLSYPQAREVPKAQVTGAENVSSEDTDAAPATDEPKMAGGKRR